MTKYTARVLALAALLGGCASSAFAQTPRRRHAGAFAASGYGGPGDADDLRRARARRPRTCRRQGRVRCST